MPIYEYYSKDTHRIYSFFARRILQAHEIPRCPDGARHRMEKMISRFAITGKAKEKPDVPAEGFDPRQEAAMMQLASEMEGMDENNPNPRQLGHLMRRMSDLTGEKMPPEMQEMMQRMEAGEDMEKLEAEYGDVMGDENGPGETAAGESEESNTLARIRRRLAEPRRDPTLYEAAEYLG